MKEKKIHLKKSLTSLLHQAIQLLNSAITTYDLPESRRSIICLSLRLRQIIYLLATDKSPYFAQPCPIIVNYSHYSYYWLFRTIRDYSLFAIQVFQTPFLYQRWLTLYIQYILWFTLVDYLTNRLTRAVIKF